MEEFQIMSVGKVSRAIEEDKILREVDLTCKEAGQTVLHLSDAHKHWPLIFKTAKKTIALLVGPEAIHNLPSLKTSAHYEAAIILLLARINQAVEERA